MTPAKRPNGAARPPTTRRGPRVFSTSRGAPTAILSVRLTPDERRQLEEEAAATGDTAGGVVRRLIAALGRGGTFAGWAFAPGWSPADPRPRHEGGSGSGAHWYTEDGGVVATGPEGPELGRGASGGPQVRE